MNPTLIESRKWFQGVVALLSLAVAITCYVVVDAAFPASAGGAKLALLLLAWGAFYGFDQRAFVLPLVRCRDAFQSQLRALAFSAGSS